MKRSAVGILLLAAMVLVGGAIFLMTWDIPPPKEPVSRTIDDGRFPR